MTSSSRLRIIVADDSAVFRTVLRRVLERIPGVELVATASNGKRAVELVEQERPDMLLLDVHMPVMTGPEALQELTRRGLDTAVVVISASDPTTGDKTIQLLRAGALDFIMKPVGGRGVNAADLLLDRLQKTLATFKASRHGHRRPTGRSVTPPPAARPAAPRPTAARRRSPNIRLITIAVSTGGPAALGRLLPQLPGNLPVPVLVVQHMPAHFTEHLARSLDRECSLQVAEAADGEALAAGTIRIAKGDHHLTLARGSGRVVCKLDQGPPVHSCRPAADPLFSSAATLYGENTLGIVLTGMGSDGLDGVRSLRRKGGLCLVQEAASCAVYGMPRAVIEAGEADEVLDLDAMARRITALVQGPQRRTA